MANQYTKLSAENINVKMTRKRNPVQSVAELAREFGYNTEFFRSDSTWGSAAPGAFRNKVKALVGEETYARLRDSRKVPRRYR